MRGTAPPLLLDLAKKPNFLDDNSVPTLEALLDGSRGPMAPHPFHVTNATTRATIISYLQGIESRQEERVAAAR